MNTPSPGDRILVVGGGLAALRMVAELRERGFDGHLTVVADETHAPYDRPPLSKELFTRDSPAFLEEQGLGEWDGLVDRLLQPARVLSLDVTDDGATATVVGIDIGERVDPEHRRQPLALAEPLVGATTLDADLVVLATGSEPIVPAGLENALTLRTWQDASNVRAALGRLPGASEVPGDAGVAGGAGDHDAIPFGATELVVVGAGWIGAEVASSAARAGVEVTVLEAGPLPLGRELGPEFGARTMPWFAEAGVDLRVNARVVRIDGHTLRLADTSSMSAQAILLAVGARPRTDLVADLATRDRSGAVLVHPDGSPVGGPAALRVVGDAATIVLPDGTRVPGGHWDGALHHPGLVAADIVCRRDQGVVADELGQVPAPSTFSSMFGREILTFGSPHGTILGKYLVREDDAGWTGLTVDSQGHLLGAVLVDHPRDASALRKALAHGARPRVDVTRLADVSVPLRDVLRGR